MRLIDVDKLNLWTALRLYCSSDVCCEVTDIINNAPTVNPYEWISVDDRLPTHQKEVSCDYGFDRGGGDLGMMFMGTLCYFCFDENPHWQHSDHNLVVTHWMPLPEPPTEKEN